MSKEKDFKFYVPIELMKAEGESEDWVIQGIASTPDEDLQGEVVDQNGLDISMLKAGRGVFNFDHQKGPENILGQIETADFIDQDGKKALMVKGYLFKHQDRAKAFHNILKSLKKGSGPRVHMSIEGKVLQRDFMNNKSIKKARIDKVALTLDPVNPYTYAELVKSLNSPEAVEFEAPVTEPAQDSENVVISKADLQVILDYVNKAMTAGIGHASAPESRSGGAAMTKESLESKVKSVTYGDKKKKDQKTVVKSLVESLSKAHPDENPLKLAELVIDAFFDKVDEE